MEDKFETKAPKKPRTEAQKKATENMLMRLKEKRKEAEEAVEMVKAKAKEIRKAEVKPSGRPKQEVALDPRLTEAKIIRNPPFTEHNEPNHSIDYDALAERISSKIKTKKSRKVMVDISDSSDSSDSSSSEEEIVITKTKKSSKSKSYRNEAPEPEPTPVFRGTGNRVLDSLFYNRR